MKAILKAQYNLISIFRILDISIIAVIMLFFSETSYYLLILQTGIIEHFHSNLYSIWMIPVGGILGIISIYKLKYHRDIVMLSLLTQTLLMFFYPNFNMFALFILGFSSGIIAPYIIYQLKNLQTVVISLGLAYIFGTIAIRVPADHRAFIAISLSFIAFISLYFISPIMQEKKAKIGTDFKYIFLWLLLDATLFEMLSRSDLAIWKDISYMPVIITFHLTGLILAYFFQNSKHNTFIIFTLFSLSYLAFILEIKPILAVIYPIVISYYNVIILKKFITFSQRDLALASLSLWASAGMGLFLALNLIQGVGI
jgi:hypothetical protein